MKKVYHVRTKQHGGLKLSLSQAINSTISQSLCAGAPCWWSCNQQQKSSYSNNCVKVIVWSNFCGCNGKPLTICQQWSRLSSPSKRGSHSATDSTSWDKQACTHDTLWHQYYITTSKEYL